MVSPEWKIGVFGFHRSGRTGYSPVGFKQITDSGMKEMEFSVDPRLIAAARVPSSAGRFEREIVHSADLFCLVTDGRCWMDRGAERVPLASGTLLLIKAGEVCPLKWSPRSKSNLWMVYFQASLRLYGQLPALAEPDAGRRIWMLGEPEMAYFKDLFVRLTVERAGGRAEAREAEAGWLTLMLVAIQRWHDTTEEREGVDTSWKVVSQPPLDGHPSRESESLDSDVLRRRFRYISRGL